MRYEKIVEFSSIIYAVFKLQTKTDTLSMKGFNDLSHCICFLQELPYLLLVLFHPFLVILANAKCHPLSAFVKRLSIRCN